MSDPAQQQPGTKLTTSRGLSPERQAQIDESKARNALTVAIRGTLWSKEANENTIRAIAEYCWRNRLDPVRHVELLGGRIYLTGTLYQEKAAPYIRAGVFVPDEPVMAHHDPRLDELAAEGDEWAIAERTTRKRLRIQHGIPEAAEGAVIFRITVAQSGATFTGVNWCGKGLKVVKKEIWEAGPNGKRQPTGRFEEKDSDPVGGTDPVKTAITRAQRRAWLQLVEGGAAMSMASDFAHFAADAEAVEAKLEEVMIQQTPKVIEAPRPANPFGSFPESRPLATEPDGAYGGANPNPAPESLVGAERDTFDDRAAFRAAATDDVDDLQS